MVGLFFDTTIDFSIGGAIAGALELTTSPTLAISAIIGIEDENNPLIHSGFNWDLKACAVYPGSSTDWVIASDLPLFYTRVEPTNTAAATSYYIDTGDHTINN